MCDNTNSSIFYGNSSRLKYDEDYYRDYLEQTTAVGNYFLDPNYIDNCQRCLPKFGPRTSQGSLSFGVSTPGPYTVPNFGNTVDVESILTNRNVQATKNGTVNPINVTDIPVVNAKICSNFLDPISTHLTNPAINYKGLPINRFYDLNRNPQRNIFYDFATITQLETKDNYMERIPMPMEEQVTFPKNSYRNDAPKLFYGVPGSQGTFCTYTY
jgi:hypothetical protein